MCEKMISLHMLIGKLCIEFIVTFPVGHRGRFFFWCFSRYSFASVTLLLLGVICLCFCDVCSFLTRRDDNERGWVHIVSAGK